MPDLLNDEPNLSLTNPPAPAPEKRKGTRERKRLCDKQLPPHPIYVASYKEKNTPTLVNNLIPRPTPEERRDTSKTMADRRNLMVIRGKEDKQESDWDSGYSYLMLNIRSDRKYF